MRISRCFVLFSMLLVMHPGAPTSNFVGPFSKEAEEARIRSAVFWTGKELPGKWSKPATITVRYGNHSGGGYTSFKMKNGEVFDWNIFLAGKTNEDLLNVLNHEVDHAVRYSIVRHSIVRWMDEGCSSLFERREDHERLRRIAIRNTHHISSPWRSIDNDAYDQNGVEVQYALGFSIVEYLIHSHGKDKVLGFQKDARKPSEKWAEFFDKSVEESYFKWLGWFKGCFYSGDGYDCLSFRCPVHNPAGKAPASRPQTKPQIIPIPDEVPLPSGEVPVPPEDEVPLPPEDEITNPWGGKPVKDKDAAAEISELRTIIVSTQLRLNQLIEEVRGAKNQCKCGDSLCDYDRRISGIEESINKLLVQAEILSKKECSCNEASIISKLKSDPNLKGEKGERGEKGEKGEKGDQGKEGECFCDIDKIVEAVLVRIKKDEEPNAEIPEGWILYVTSTKGCPECSSLDAEIRRLQNRGYPIRIMDLEPSQAKIQGVPALLLLKEGRRIEGISNIRVFLALHVPR